MESEQTVPMYVAGFNNSPFNKKKSPLQPVIKLRSTRSIPAKSKLFWLICRSNQTVFPMLTSHCQFFSLSFVNLVAGLLQQVLTYKHNRYEIPATIYHNHHAWVNIAGDAAQRSFQIMHIEW